MWWQPQDLAAVDDAVGRARDGIPTLLSIEGSEGTGKTALLRRVTTLAEGFARLSGRGDPTASQPFGLLLDWGVIEPALATTITPFQAANALRRHVASVRSGAPMLLVVDDLQWLDRDSVETLVHLMSGLMGHRLLVVTATRPTHSARFAAWRRLVIDADQTVAVALTGLDLAGTTALVRSSDPAIDDALVEQLHRHTGGNPLFLRQILRDYDDAALCDLAALDELPAPAQVIDGIDGRLSTMDPESAALLRAVAVSGDGWTPLRRAAALAGVTDGPETAARLGGIDLLERRGTGGLTDIRCPSSVIRVAVHDTMPRAERRRLHLAAAAESAAPGVALRHRVLAAEGDDGQLAADLIDHAWTLRRSQHYREAARFEFWASSVTADPVLREQRWLDALFDAALARDTPFATQQLATVTSTRDEARRALVRGLVLIVERRWSEARTALQSITDDMIDGAERYVRFRIHTLRAWVQLVTGPPTAPARADARAAVGEVGSDSSLGTYLTFAVAMAEGTSALAEPIAGRAAEVSRLAWRGAALAVVGAPTEAVRSLEPVTARIDEGRSSMGDGVFHALLGFTHWLRADWRRAAALITHARDARVGGVHPMVEAIAPLAPLALGNVSAVADGRRAARQALRDGPWPQAIAVATVVDVLALRLAGDAAARQRYFSDLRADFGEVGFPTAAPALWLLSSGMAAAWGGQTALTGAIADELQRSPAPIGWRDAGVSWLRGLAAERSGDLGGALQFLRAAADAGLADLRVHGALLLDDLGRVASAADDARAAATARRDAGLLLADAGGAHYLAPTAVDPLAPLSAREREVITLLARGLSYAQIAKELYLSRSTVAFHLSNAYAKTGTTSRHEVVELVARP